VDAVRADRERMVGSEEREFDRWTVEMLRSTEACVFDVWFLPWFLNDGDAIRIWLDVPRELRVRRIVEERTAGQSPTTVGNSGHDYDSVGQDLGDKDERNRAYALQTYGIDIETDLDVFELRIAVKESLPPNDLTDLIHAVLTRGMSDASAAKLGRERGDSVELSGPLVTRG